MSIQNGTATVESSYETQSVSPISFNSLIFMSTSGAYNSSGIVPNVTGTFVQITGSGFTNLPGFSTKIIYINFLDSSGNTVITCDGYPYSDTNIVFVIPPFINNFVPGTYTISNENVDIDVSAMQVIVVDLPPNSPSIISIALGRVNLDVLPTSVLVEVTSLNQIVTIYGTNLNPDYSSINVWDPILQPVLFPGGPVGLYTYSDYFINSFIASGYTNNPSVYYYTISINSWALSSDTSDPLTNGIYSLISSISSISSMGTPLTGGIGIIVNLP